MRSSRLVFIVLGIALGLAALPPAVALASGPSAGDQQYVDPLGGSTGSGSSGSHSSHSSGSSSSSSGASSGSTGTIASGSTAATTASTTTATATPTATTTAATTTSTTTSTRTLPFTGFNAWEGALIGVALVGGGAILRRRVAPRTPGR